jgi:beta-fructofuranosidase
MNDPNGLIQWNGRFHMFYQHNPDEPRIGRMVWGHTSTADLWSWQDHPIALVPDPAGPDRDGCFSGCAIVPDGRPHLLYTGVNGPQQLPCLAEATSTDLTSWKRYGGNPVIASPPPGEAVTAFRDHCAWWADSMWYQVVGGGLQDRGGAMFLYRSADLLTWEYVGEFAVASDHGLPGSVWECPDVFAINDTVVAVVSVWDANPPYPMWMTGHVAGHKFIPHAAGRCDSGFRYYAPQSLTMDDGRRIQFGWLQERVDELTGDDRARVGVMSLPRELYLDTHASLRSRPASELDGARRDILITRHVTGHGKVPVSLSARGPYATEIGITTIRNTVTALRLRLTGHGREDVEITATPDAIRVTEGQRALTTAASAKESSESQVSQVRVFYDGGVLEVYSSAGTAAAVICDRHASYDLAEIELFAPAGAPAGAVRVTAWACGQDHQNPD